ncbi:MAG: phosphatase PAP2 family protein [Lachnospiraceae bacterium]|nr:phosphatase PAP2 family protein [Candidatus Colinaster equi]
MKETNAKNKLIVALIMTVVSVISTICIAVVDVQPIGPQGTYVGIAKVNGLIASLCPYNEMWYKISKPFLYIALLTLPAAALVGLIQLIQRKSLKKIDVRLWISYVYIICLGIIYIVFDKVIVLNYRPVELNGLEPSFPSTHAFLVVSLLLGTAVVLRGYIKNDNVAKAVILIAVALSCFTVIARTLSGVHWVTDLIGGVLYALTVVSFLKYALCRFESENM